MTDYFGQYHPSVQFLYFTLVVFYTIYFMHPVFLLISLVCALVYAMTLRSRGGWRFLLVALSTAVTAMIFNPLFNHAGATILTYLPTGNPLTLESIVYGLAAGIMLSAVMLWFFCCSQILTSDKIIYLFGRIAPTLALVLSMVLGFIPQFSRQIRAIAQGQQALGRKGYQRNWWQKIGEGTRIFSIALTWSLEHAIETAQSMKNRGYGLEHPTTFTIYTVERRDKMAILWLLVTGAGVALGWILGGATVVYYPLFGGVGMSGLSLSMEIIYLLLAATPVILNGWEDMLWKKKEN